jgi:hypothetical protein
MTGHLPDPLVYPLWYYIRRLSTRSTYYRLRAARGLPEPATAEDRQRYAERHAAKHHRVICRRHGEVTVTGSGGYTGFAGGACYYEQFSCGCYDVDESADVRAAR